MKQNGTFRSSALFYDYYNIYNIVSDLISTITTATARRRPFRHTRRLC